MSVWTAVLITAMTMPFVPTLREAFVALAPRATVAMELSASKTVRLLLFTFTFTCALFASMNQLANVRACIMIHCAFEYAVA